MRFDKWWNPHLPQMLLIAGVLLYANAVFGVLFGTVLVFPIGTLIVLGAAAAGLGINNERRWGWRLGLVIASLDLLLQLWLAGSISNVLRPENLLSIAFPAALFALLVHPQTREHQKIWFN